MRKRTDEELMHLPPEMVMEVLLKAILEELRELNQTVNQTAELMRS